MSRTMRLTTLVTLVAALAAALALALVHTAAAPADSGRDDGQARGEDRSGPGPGDRGDDRGGDDRRGRHGGKAARIYTIPGADVFPEGIATKPDSKTFFVSSAADGTIFRGRRDVPALTPFAPGGADGRSSATGMKADDHGRLFVSGGATGKAFVLSSKTGATIKALDTHPATPNASFINDVALGRKHAYFTDSLRPILWRVSTKKDTVGELEPWLDFTGTALTYESGFNLNGIAAFDDGRILVVVQTNTGKLFRIDTRSKQVSQIDLGGVTLVHGDGLLRHGSRLYVVRNAEEEIVTVKLRHDKREGEIRDRFTDDAFMFPTTVARQSGRLLVVNSQFDKQGGTPQLPFTVASVKP